MSFGGPGDPDDSLSTAADNAVYAGVVAVVAAGNSGPSEGTIGSPGTARKAITVGATDKQGNIAGFSSRGPVRWFDEDENENYLMKPDIVAPGFSICAAQSSQDILNSQGLDLHCIDDKHIAISGTSMATPHVAGVVALIKQKHSDWSPDDIKNVLKSTAVDIKESIEKQGYGRIDAEKVVRLNHSMSIANIETISLFRTFNRIDINGTAQGKGFGSYEVYYYFEEQKNRELICRGEKEVNNGFLCSFNFERLSEGEYYLILEVYDGDGVLLSKAFSIFYLDKSLYKGWPKKLRVFADSLTPALEDIDSDGAQEIIIHTTVSEYVLYGNGSFFKGWPTSKHSPSFFTNAQITSAAIADINNDGKLEVITNLRDYYAYRNVPSDYSYCFNVYTSEGKIYPGWPLRCLENSYSNAQAVPLIVSDLDGDHSLEIIGGSSPQEEGVLRIHVLKNDGTSFMEWPYAFDKTYSRDAFYYNPGITVRDIDNDDKKEVIALIRNISWSSFLFMWDYNGSLREGYPLEMPSLEYEAWGSPIIADINNDGLLEFSVFRDTGNCYYNNGMLTYFNLNGTELEWWPKSFTDQFIANSVAISDIDNDGKLESIFGTVGSCDNRLNYSVHVLRSDNTIQEGWPKKVIGGVWSEASVGDIDGDGSSEILVSTDQGYVYAFDKFGNILTGFPKRMDGPSKSGVAIGDIDGDDRVDIVSATNEGRVYVWGPFGEYRKENMQWPQFQHDAQHTGCYGCDENLTFITPVTPVEPPKHRPQSKITNDGNKNIWGNLNIYMQRNVKGQWADVEGKLVVDYQVNIPAKGLVKLDAIFNPRGFSLNEAGNYRVYAVFEYSTGSKKEASWEFSVV